MKTNLFNFLFLFLFLYGCYNEPKQMPTKGSLTVYADKTIFPLIQKEKEAFESGYPDAKVELVKVSTNDGFNKLINYKAKLFIGSRSFTEREQNFINDQKIDIRTFKFVYDGVTVITQKNSQLNYLSTRELKNILLGKNKNLKVLIPDSSTSTYFLIKKILLDNKKPANSIFVDEDSIVNKISNSRNTLGFVGVNLIQDSTKIKILKIGDLSSKNGAIAYYSPHPGYIYKNYYPLSRTIYIFLDEIGNGLASGFATYLTSGTGQKIALKNNISPAAVPVIVHE